MLRSWPKSLLFFLLLTALGVTLSIGVSLTTSMLGFLKDCDDTYTTIAVFEYIGTDYPDETIFDPDIARCLEEIDFDEIGNDPAVLNWDRNDVAFGYIAGKTDDAADPPYKKAVVAAILILSFNERENCYQYAVEKNLVNPDIGPDGGYIDTNGIELEIGHIYMIHGTRASGTTSHRYFRIAPLDYAAAALAGVDGSVGKMLEDVTIGRYEYEIPEDSIFIAIAETYGAINTGVSVHAVNDVEAYLPFQQADLSVIKGRSFTREEYDDGAKVCLLPERLAELIGAAPGSVIDLSMVVNSGAVQRESYWAGTGFTYNGSYTVVGLFSPNDDYRDIVIIPKSDATDISANRYSYTLGQAHLKNDQAERFYMDMVNVLPPRVRMTVYDQGYAAAAAPLRDVLRIVFILTAVCALTMLAMLALYGFLFVYRQRNLAKTMRRAGVANGGIFCYFLFGSGCLGLISAALGAVVSNSLSGYFIEIVRQTITNYATDDLRYSNSKLAIEKAIEFAPKTEPAVFALTALALFFFAILACLIFTMLSVRSERQRKRRRLRRSGTRSRSLSGGALKYAWLSLERGASRSLLPVMLCALAAALLLQLISTTITYEAGYDQLVRDSDISGYFTDYKGIWRSRLRLDGKLVNNICLNDTLSELSITKAKKYAYGVEWPEPFNAFTYETFLDNVAAGPGYIYTNNLAGVQEFYGCPELPVAFADGYDLSIFSQIPRDEIPIVDEVVDNTYVDPRWGAPAPCIVSTAFLHEKGLALGDVIDFYAISGDELRYEVVQIVGSYIKQGSDDNIYMPLSAYHVMVYSNVQFIVYPGVAIPKRSYQSYYSDIPASYIYDPDPDPRILLKLSFDSMNFKLRGAAGLGAFKDFLYDEGYSEVNNIRNIRSFVIVEDKTFLAAQRAMSQRLWYMQKIFPILYILLELLAALIPFILIQMRKRESALMRAQGASGYKAFLSLFIEQTMLCLPGVILGAGIWFAVFRTVTVPGLTLAGVFALLWLLGTGISAVTLNRGSVQSILRAEE